MNTDRIQLRQTLVDHFDLEELRTLCDDLDVDFESLVGRGKAGKARELVRFMQRRERLDELAAAIASFLSPQDRPAATPTYHLVDIRIFASEQDVYRVELTVAGGGEFLDRQLQLDESALRNLGTEDYGRALGKALFAEQAIGDAYQQTVVMFQSQNEQVRVRLQLDSPVLHDIRWEGIYHLIAGAWRPLATAANTLLSRYVPAEISYQHKALTNRPLRALVILASPNNLEQRGLAKISAAELEAWHAVFDDQQHIIPTYLESESACPPTLIHIQQALMADEYQIVHFVCHGKKTRKGTALLLQDNDGNVEPVYSGQLLETFDALTTKPHLCFLAACESGAYGHTGDVIPLGPALVAAGSVPAVVAMVDRVGIVTIREFGSQFYNRLLAHGTVDLAMHQARLMVRRQQDWSVPVLFSRLPDNQLFGASKTPGGLIQKQGLDSPVSVPAGGPPAPNPFGVSGHPAKFQRAADLYDVKRKT